MFLFEGGLSFCAVCVRLPFMKKLGKVLLNGVILEKHEQKTIVFLTELGWDVELIKPIDKKGIHTPDIKMLGEEWEIKSPKGEGDSVMKNTLQRAAKQSKNVIVDLRRTKRYQKKCLAELQREFDNSKRLRKLKIITKSKRILDFIR